MSYIECYSHMTNKNVKYNLIGVKLKHQKRDLDYGCTTDNYNNIYCNTSPYPITSYYNSRELSIYGTSGFITQGWDASGVLTSEYHNSNTGTNPVISSRTYDIEDMQVGENTEDLFSTDMIKVRITVVKKKASEAFTQNWSHAYFQKLDGTYENKDTLYVISNIVMEFILLSNNEIIGSVDLMQHQYHEFFPTRFSMNSELFNLIDFDPKYTSNLEYSSTYNMWFSYDQQTNKGIMVNGSKETTKHDFVGLTHSLLAAEGWYSFRNAYAYKQFQIQKSGGDLLTDGEINAFNVNGDILFFRHMIQTQPNEFIQFNKGYTNSGLDFTPDEQTAWIDSYMTEKGYVYADPSGTHTTFMANVFNQSPILMPMYNDMYIPLTNDIKEGEAPDPEPPEEEETMEEAIDGDTDWEADQSDGEVDYFDNLSNDNISGIPSDENLFPSGYSNFVFKHWRPFVLVGDPAVEEESDLTVWGSDSYKIAHWFIDDCIRASTYDKIHSLYKVLTGKPTVKDLIGRIYALPFGYDKLMSITSAGHKQCAPVYGVLGEVTGEWKNDPGLNLPADGTRVSIHYYTRMINRFFPIELGTKTISKVFMNYLDYKSRYVLKLPYNAGDVEIDPNFLFRDPFTLQKTNSGSIHLRGFIDFDTGALIIKVLVNEQLYYDTSINVATDLMATIADYGAFTLGLSKAAITAGTAAIIKGKGKIGAAIGALVEESLKPVPDSKPETLGLPMKDIIYGEDKEPQRKAAQKIHEMQEDASIPLLGYNGVIYGTMNPEPEKPNTTVMMADKIMDQMMETNRMNQRMFNLQFPYCELPPINPRR